MPYRRAGPGPRTDWEAERQCALPAQHVHAARQVLTPNMTSLLWRRDVNAWSFQIHSRGSYKPNLVIPNIYTVTAGDMRSYKPNLVIILPKIFIVWENLVNLVYKKWVCVCVWGGGGRPEAPTPIIGLCHLSLPIFLHSGHNMHWPFVEGYIFWNILEYFGIFGNSVNINSPHTLHSYHKLIH